MLLGMHSRVFFLKLFSVLLGINLLLVVLYVSSHKNLVLFNMFQGSPKQDVLSTSSNSSKQPVHKATPTPIQSGPTPTITPTPSLAQKTHSIYLGMWTQGFWDESNYTLHPEKLQSVESMIGKKVAIAHFYHGWQNLENPSLVTELTTISNNGWRPMLSTNPYFFADCQGNGKSLYKAIADGNCDAFLHTSAKTIKSYARPVFLRFAWEMNISAIDWSISKTNSSAQDFVSAWRHMHDVFVSEGATNAIWVFCPNVDPANSISYASLYPGDTYVDWVGLDGYNWGTTQSYTSWQTFQQVFASSYQRLISVAPNKPFMLGEVNTTDVGGDKSSWYKDALTVQLPNNFPKISAVVFYNEDRTAKEHVNWLINVTNASLAAFSSGVQLPFYLSSF